MRTVVKTKTQPAALTALLNKALASTLDLKLQAKQAHWNVRGENFIALHELFDKVATEVDDYADMLAERVVQLHGTAMGTSQAVSRHSDLPTYPADIHEGQQHVKALGKAVGLLADSLRRDIDTATAQGDAVTADLFTEVTRGLDKLHWFIRSHAK